MSENSGAELAASRERLAQNQSEFRDAVGRLDAELERMNKALERYREASRHAD